MKETVRSGLQLNKLAPDVHWEPIAIHVLKLREGNHQCLGIRTPLRSIIKNNCFTTIIGVDKIGGVTMCVLHVLKKRARGCSDVMLHIMWRQAREVATSC